MDDNICAISTSLGVGAISIIRISGKQSISIVNKIFKGKDLNNVKSHTINYGFIINKEEVIDEVLVSIMKSPKTFTKEDIVEINCHGGIAPTNKILELLISNGCRLAEPGEFSKRAFLNGRINLIEAEAISDMIVANTEKARALAINQITGSLSKIIKETRKEIVSLMANIEVNIDYPEYEDAQIITHDVLKPKLLDIKNDLNRILEESDNGKIIKNGINIALVGKPNVGKSSILNNLLEENKAIVTDIAGTTRDIVEGSIILKGISLNFIDTAGIRKTSDIVEKIGVDKSLEQIKLADLVIMVINNNEILNNDDLIVLNEIKNKKSIVFINKDDLDSKIDITKIDNDNIVYGNTLSIEGLQQLKNKIIELFNLNKLQNKDLTYLSNARQIALINKAIDYINESIKQINNNVPIDMLAIDIKNCWDALGEITGETYKDELIDELFSNFCLGK